MPTPDSDDSFNIRKNREHMICKEAEKASHLSSSMTSQAAPPGGDGKLTHAMDNTRQRFLLKEGYNASDSQVLESARQHLRELVQSRPSHPEVVDSVLPSPKLLNPNLLSPKMSYLVLLTNILAASVWQTPTVTLSTSMIRTPSTREEP